MIEITAPLERWEALTEMYSTPQAVEHKPEKGPVPVKSEVYQGHRYTAFSIWHCPWGGRPGPRIGAYRLDLPSRFDGETTVVYHDEAAILAGRRERGDHTGLLVKVARTTMVCAAKVAITPGLPTTPPVTLDQAKAWNAEIGGMGWRSLVYKDGEVTWHSLGGHPVVRYQLPDGKIQQSLIWTVDGQTFHDMYLASSVTLSSVEALSDTRTSITSPQPPVDSDEGQLGLFV